jgi:hypothetical protein
MRRLVIVPEEHKFLIKNGFKLQMGLDAGSGTREFSCTIPFAEKVLQIRNAMRRCILRCARERQHKQRTQHNSDTSHTSSP